jgi:hypothetical protein
MGIVFQTGGFTALQGNNRYSAQTIWKKKEKTSDNMRG